MKTPVHRAGILCGGLVGGCSALISAAAHSAAGGALPGGAVAILMIVCATAGATTSASLIKAREARVVVLIIGLAGAQALGHVALTAAQTHHSHGLLPSTPMLLAHAGAAVVLGLLISLVGHLYQVCTSVVSWLCLVTVHRGRPSPLPWSANPVAMLSRRLRSGLRMRAPPLPVPSGG